MKSKKNRLTGKFFFIISAAAILLFPACQQAYFKTMEQFGYHKRDLLVSSVIDARDSQEQAKEQFKSALEKFGAVINFQGGELEKTYNQLNSEFIKSEKRANTVNDRIDEVEDVAKALFKEWESELNQYSSQKLQAESKQQLEQTKDRYTQMMSAMRRAESKLEPILATFRDQVLFIKHNLNSRAISSIKTELTAVESNISSLVKEMEASIAEANSFIESMETQ